VLSGLDGVRIEFKKREEIKKEQKKNQEKEIQTKNLNKPFILQTKNPGEYQDREIYIEADGKEVEIYESGSRQYKAKNTPNQKPIILVTLAKDITYKEFPEVLIQLRSKIKTEKLEPKQIENKLENLEYQAELMGYCQALKNLDNQF